MLGDVVWCRTTTVVFAIVQSSLASPAHNTYMIVEFEGIFASWHIICGPLLQVEQYSRRWSLMRLSLIITLYHQDRCVGAHQGATAQCWYQVLDVVEENGQSRGAVWVWMMSEISLRYVLEMEVLMWSRWRSLETVLTCLYRYLHGSVQTVLEIQWNIWLRSFTFASNCTALHLVDLKTSNFTM